MDYSFAELAMETSWMAVVKMAGYATLSDFESDYVANEETRSDWEEACWNRIQELFLKEEGLSLSAYRRLVSKDDSEWYGTDWEGSEA